MRSTTTALMLLLSAAAAQAADFPMLRGTQDDFGFQAAPSSINWSGFYAGLHGGYSAGEIKPGTTAPDLARQAYRDLLLSSEYDVAKLVDSLPLGDDRSRSFGGFAGYNYFSSNIMVGLEIDYTRSKQGAEADDFIARRYITSNGIQNDISLTTHMKAELRDYMTARVRAGWAIGSFLPFVTGGVAVGRADVRTHLAATYDFALPDPNNAGSFLPEVTASGYPLALTSGKKNAYSAGFALGGGVDVALASYLFLRGEYQFVRFGSFKGAEIDVHTIRGAVAAKF